MSFHTTYTSQENLYESSLKEIQGIKFTFREIDVISCIVHNRGEKKIASILSVSPRTISAHVYNIMNKLGHNSKDQIIDFMEKAGILPNLRQYYLHLLVRTKFENLLVKIARRANRLGATHCYDQGDAHGLQQSLYQSINKHFALANVKLVSVTQDEKVIIDLTRITADNYYRNIIDYLQELLAEPSIIALIEEFEQERQTISEMHNGKAVIFENQKDLAANNITKYRKLIIVLVIISAMLITAAGVQVYSKRVHAKVTNQVKDTNVKMIGELEQLLSSKNFSFSANNLSTEQKRQNHGAIKRMEQLFTNYTTNEIREYFVRNEVLPSRLINYLYSLHALASYYIYQQHDGLKARKILYYSKGLAEDYINSRSKVPLDFNALSPEEILTEFDFVEDLAEMYTKILYSLGKSFIYQGEVKDGISYLQKARHLGYELGVFEGYLSERSGLGPIYKIEAESEVRKGMPHNATKILLNVINMYSTLQSDHNSYVLDYNPKQEIKKIIKPIEDVYNIVECGEKIIQSFIILIKISKDANSKTEYLEKIIKQIDESHKFPALLKNVQALPPRKAASLHNTLAFVLLTCKEANLNCDKFINILRTKMSIKATVDLQIAKELFNRAKTKSCNTDYTKADSYSGLIKVHKIEMQNPNLSQTKKDALAKEIDILQTKCDNINSALNRLQEQNILLLQINDQQ